jgi:hypothetical protein
LADKEARPYCRAANGLRKKSASRGFLLTASARRTEMSTLLHLAANLYFTRHQAEPVLKSPIGITDFTDSTDWIETKSRKKRLIFSLVQSSFT